LVGPLSSDRQHRPDSAAMMSTPRVNTTCKDRGG
jgi:hypothetical protein